MLGQRRRQCTIIDLALALTRLVVFSWEGGGDHLSTTKRSTLCGMADASQQVWVINPMLSRCWASVRDVSPTLGQHRLNVHSGMMK